MNSQAKLFDVVALLFDLPEDEMKAPAFMHGDEIASRFQPPVNIVFYIPCVL